MAIVVGGCARSGTTLLATLLSAHPRVHLYSEGDYDRETRVFCRAGRNLDTALGRLLARDPPHPAATRWCEKTATNVRHIERILEHFGARVRFLNIVRDGRDVVTSVHPSAPHRHAVKPNRWVRDVQAGREGERDPRLRTFRYEDLVAAPERVLRSVCEFVELPFEANMLRYPEAAAVRQSGAWFGDEARPIDSAGVGRWRDARHRERVLELWRCPGAEELMAFYGYA